VAGMYGLVCSYEEADLVVRSLHWFVFLVLAVGPVHV